MDMNSFNTPTPIQITNTDTQSRERASMVSSLEHITSEGKPEGQHFSAQNLKSKSLDRALSPEDIDALLEQNWTIVSRKIARKTEEETRSTVQNSQTALRRKEKQKARMKRKRQLRREYRRVASAGNSVIPSQDKAQGTQGEAESERLGNPPSLKQTQVMPVPSQGEVLGTSGGEKGDSLPERPQSMPGPSHGRDCSLYDGNIKLRLSPVSSTGSNNKSNEVASSVEDIKFEITSNTGFISRATAEQIESKLEEAMLRVAWSKDRPDFTKNGLSFSRKPIYLDGCLRLTCTNTTTLEWVQQIVRDLPGDLVVLQQAEEIPRIRCGFVLPKLWKYDQSLLSKVLQLGNPDLKPERWQFNGLLQQPTVDSTFVVVSVPEDTVSEILARGRRLSFLTGSVYLKFRDTRGKFVDTPPTSKSGMTLEPPSSTTSTPASTPDAGNH